jgi:hypothetical protein
MKLPFLLIFPQGSRDCKLVDWKKRCEELWTAFDKLNTSHDSFREMYEKHVADWKGLVKKKLDLIEAAHLRIAELEGKLAAINGAPPTPEPEKVQSPIERQNMLKAIFGMAVRGYSYNPADQRSKTVAEIVSDLGIAGHSTLGRYDPAISQGGQSPVERVATTSGINPRIGRPGAGGNERRAVMRMPWFCRFEVIEAQCLEFWKSGAHLCYDQCGPCVRRSLNVAARACRHFRVFSRSVKSDFNDKRMGPS